VLAVDKVPEAKVSPMAGGQLRGCSAPESPTPEMDLAARAKPYQQSGTLTLWLTTTWHSTQGVISKSGELGTNRPAWFLVAKLPGRLIPVQSANPWILPVASLPRSVFHFGPPKSILGNCLGHPERPLPGRLANEAQVRQLAGPRQSSIAASCLIVDGRRTTHFGQSQRPKADGERTKLLGGQAIWSPHAARTV